MTSAAKLIRELRLIPACIGAASILMANRLYEVHQLALAEAVQTTFYPYLWAWWMVIAGVLCCAYSIKMANRWLGGIAGAAVISGFASRALAVIIQLQQGTSSLPDAQLHVIGIIYTVAAFSVYTIWIRLLRPATSLLAKAEDR